ncbi:slipin family protein [Paenibacillus sp. LHD-117]|uniref:slipin family protein n=1 Tax=Paenibacillus sp. LHD-117 TaxID=3071412 RepID=UPI0027DF9556|nr:slipin family protein [Paenibacillus sp. LHD-117]MDQ6419994.1 slipin family protein [Paenibacillus sp. LHD-117]
MIQTIIVTDNERGLLFKKGSYERLLRPGTYRFAAWSGYTVEKQELTEPFDPAGRELNLFLRDSELLSELHVVEVADGEYALHYEDGRFAKLLTPGVYAFWNVLKKHSFTAADTRSPEASAELVRPILNRLTGYIQVVEVASHETGLLFYDNVLQRELRPGRYFFWRGAVSVAVRTADLRQQQLDMTGQEIMTEDKVSLRLNFVCQYRIANPLRALEIKGFEDQVYILLQLILREYVGTMKLDDLLRMKQEIGAYVLGRLNERSEAYGVKFVSAGLKDIILPGDVRDILNTVLLAEKKAQANLITRREETASTRSLLNTAKLMDENGTLYRLKELEFLEKICEKIGTISLTGGGSLLEGLNSLLSANGAGGANGAKN